MNRIYRSIWNGRTGTSVAVSEISGDGGGKSTPGAVARNSRFALKGLAVSLMLAFGSNIHALPTGGAVSAGSASIASNAGTTTINQSSQKVAINWQGFSVGQAEAVRFVQPNSSAVALNRVLGPDPSSILGSLSANGKVFLINPNGILFGKGAQVNVGGLVASTRNISDSDFMAGNYKFSGSGGGTIVNQGTINADGGYVALLGANISNEGVISARLGTVALAAGNAATLDVAGDGLLNVTVSQGAVNALVQNGGLIKADGGHVLLTAMAAGNLLQSAVNNTGVIQAQTIENHNGTIRLMGDMQIGTTNVGGTLDASAPNGGNGGFIETSAAHVNIANDARITTAAPGGVTGTWLIDPIDFNIAALGGDITGLALTQLLVNNNVTISTAVTGVNTPTTFFAAPGQGDINVNDVIGAGSGALWTAAGATTTLTLIAAQDVNINQSITATNGNLVVCCGRDVNVRAAITTTNGSVLLSGGRDVTLFAGSAMSTTNGNIALCAGRNVDVRSAITLVDFAAIASQSLGLADGLVLSAGNNGTGPGAAGGTVIFAPLTPPAAITRAPVTIFYNPVSYAAPTNYNTPVLFTLVGPGSPLTQFMLVFPDGGSKAFDGTTATTFTGLKGIPAGIDVTLAGAGTANFDTAAVGVGKTVTFSGFALAGADAGQFALPGSSICCTPAVQRTTADITPALVVVPIPPILPIVPPVVPPLAGVTPPFSPAPVLIAPVAAAFDVPQLELAGDAMQAVPGLNLDVTGIRMPPTQLAFTPPPPPAPAIVPEAPPIFVAPPAPPPPRPARPDRN